MCLLMKYTVLIRGIFVKIFNLDLIKVLDVIFFGENIVDREISYIV